VKNVADRVVVTFPFSNHNLDDNDQKGNPYPLGAQYVHRGNLEFVDPALASVGLYSWGVEDDVPFGHDAASTFGVPPGGLPFPALMPELPFPAGQSAETVTNSSFLMDCPASSGDFHYGVDIRWSVEYGA
jgi:hypothetical protein